jgi:hypothetical protein
MLFMDFGVWLETADHAAQPLQRRPKSRRDIGAAEDAASAALKEKLRLKKRRVKWRRAFQQNVWQLLVGGSVYSKEPPGNPRHCLISARCSDPTEKCFPQFIHNFGFALPGLHALTTSAAKQQ